jgi:hypothetical protein
MKITLFILLFFSFITKSFSTTLQEANEAYLKAISHNAKMENVLNAEEHFLELEKHHETFYNKLRLASITALKAKFSTFKKISLVNSAIDKFNALELVLNQDSVVDLYEFHFFRGRVFYQLPKFFGKKEIAKEDIIKAVQILESQKLKRDDGEVARLFLSFALVLKDEGKEGEAKKFAQKSLQFNALEKEDVLIAKELIGK